LVAALQDQGRGGDNQPDRVGAFFSGCGNAYSLQRLKKEFEDKQNAVVLFEAAEVIEKIRVTKKSGKVSGGFIIVSFHNRLIVLALNFVCLNDYHFQGRIYFKRGPCSEKNVGASNIVSKL